MKPGGKPELELRAFTVGAMSGFALDAKVFERSVNSDFLSTPHVDFEQLRPLIPIWRTVTRAVDSNLGDAVSNLLFL